MACPICNHRKEKRFCLALHDKICPQCCGEQREVTIDCPSECTYLQKAREHEGSHRVADTPPDELFAKISVSDQFLNEHEALIGGFVQTLGKLSDADRSLRDRDITGAVTVLAKEYQTLVGSGLVYAETSPSPVQQALVTKLRALVQEFRDVEQRHLGYVALKDSDILKMLVFVLRMISLSTSGRPLSRGFIDFLQAQFPLAAASPQGADEEESRIILP